MKKAYDNWHQVIEYDGQSLLNSKQTRRVTRSSMYQLSAAPAGFSSAVDNQLALPQFPVSVPSEQPLMESAPPVAGCYFAYSLFPFVYVQKASLNSKVVCWCTFSFMLRTC